MVGFVVDVGVGQIEVPSEKITALRSALRQATQSPRIKARSLASVIGKIISMAVRVVYSDANETGYGGFVVEHGAYISHGQWTAEQAKCSSTWRELSAVRMVLAAVADKLSQTVEYAGLQPAKMLSVFCKWVVESLICNQ